MHRMFLACLTLLMACGPAPQAAGESLGATSSALQCDSGAHDNGDGTLTRIACPWERQWSNIMKHGARLTRPSQLLAAGEDAGVEVTHRCGDWLLGNDAKGLTVFVNASTGELRSHGPYDPRFATSALPTKLAGPLALEDP